MQNPRFVFYLVLSICAYLLLFVFANVYSVLNLSFLNRPLFNSYIITEMVVAIIILIRDHSSCIHDNKCNVIIRRIYI